jgi:hypothetical protein
MNINKIEGFNDLCELSSSTVEKIFKAPDPAIKKINNVGIQVIQQFSLPIERAAVETFLKQVVYLNEQYREKLKKTPFDDTISKLRAKLAQTEDRCRKQLKSLNIDSPTFSRDLQEVLLFVEKSTELNSVQKNQLKGALLALKSPSYLGEELFETHTLQVLCRKSTIFEKAFEEAALFFKNYDREAQRSLLKHLQQSDLSLGQMADTVSDKVQSLKRDTMRAKIQLIGSKMPDHGKALEGHFFDNFYSLSKALEKFALLADTVLQKAWAQILATHQGKDNLFLKILQEYSWMDPQQCMSYLLEQVENRYVQFLSFDAICSLNSPDFKAAIQKRNVGVEDKIRNYFIDYYKSHLVQSHLWLWDNLQAIKKPYNQAAHTDVNMGEGTCFQNALERHALLLKDPYKDGTTIPMGSSAKGRATLGSVNYAYEEAAKGKLSKREANKIQETSSLKLGLQLSEQTSIAKPKDFAAGVIEQLDQLSKNGFLGIISILSPEGGHAFNIQIDHQNQIFRFIDDNMGVCEWSSYKQFQTQFAAYLKAMYSDYTSFYFQKHIIHK